MKVRLCSVALTVGCLEIDMFLGFFMCMWQMNLEA